MEAIAKSTIRLLHVESPAGGRGLDEFDEVVDGHGDPLTARRGGSVSFVDGDACVGLVVGGFCVGLVCPLIQA